MKLYIDQYGTKIFARSRKELKTKHCIPGKMSPMYVDGKDGAVYNVGVVIGNLWFDEYTLVPSRKKAKA